MRASTHTRMFRPFPPPDLIENIKIIMKSTPYYYQYGVAKNIIVML
jgi:hypothetical protein